MGVVGVGFVVPHGVVDITAFVVEQLGEGHHRGVLEVLAKAPGHQVNVNPPDVGLVEDGRRKELRVAFGDCHKLLGLLHVLAKLLFGHLSDNWILQQGELFLPPESQIVDLPRKILNQVEPLRFLSLSKLVEDERQQFLVLRRQSSLL